MAANRRRLSTKRNCRNGVSKVGEEERSYTSFNTSAWLTLVECSGEIRIQRNAPGLEQRFGDVASMAVFFTPTPQFVGTRAVLSTKVQLAHLFLELRYRWPGGNKAARCPVHGSDTLELLHTVAGPF